MNGNELKKLGAMSDEAWRGYIAGKLEGFDSKLDVLGTAVVAHAKAATTAVKSVHALELKLAEFPQKCPEGRKVGALDKRVDELEKGEAGRKAVSKFKGSLYGAIGGGVFFLLNLLFSFVRDVLAK